MAVIARGLVKALDLLRRDHIIHADLNMELEAILIEKFQDLYQNYSHLETKLEFIVTIVSKFHLLSPPCLLLLIEDWHNFIIGGKILALVFVNASPFVRN